MTHATRVQSGKRQDVPLVDAAPGLVCSGVVVGPWRQIAPTDIVYDYGNLPSWHFLLPCRTEVRGGPVGLKEVQRVLGSKRPPRTFELLPLDSHQFAGLVGFLRADG